jgi:hypothetical protein
MSVKVEGKILLALLVIAIVITFFSVITTIVSIKNLPHNYIANKYILQPQIITQVMGPPLYVEQTYHIILYNGIIYKDEIVDVEIYDKYNLGDYYGAK